jgi:hypothetical protein
LDRAEGAGAGLKCTADAEGFLQIGKKILSSLLALTSLKLSESKEKALGKGFDTRIVVERLDYRDIRLD